MTCNTQLILWMKFLLIVAAAIQLPDRSCERSSCVPKPGNLMIGREHRLYASSTCGLYHPESYYIVSNLQDNKSLICDSRSKDLTQNHQISNIKTKFHNNVLTWWQSENSKDQVWIQLNLEAQFLMTHLIITFQSFRPAAMLIERSNDHASTWKVHAYFARDCEKSFPGVPEREPTSLTDVTCVSKYSDIQPSTDGEVVYKSLLPHFEVNRDSEEVQDLLKITNLRINFTKLHTLGDDILDTSMNYRQKYYYAINQMVVMGSCFCHGHADNCIKYSRYDTNPSMVYGKCQCKHNTKGMNCNQCLDFYNDLPWKPAFNKTMNVCKRCDCNNHATSCHFDMRVYNASGSVSGGVCDRCKHNTTGNNCQICKPYFYRDLTKDITDPQVCLPCDCDKAGITNNGVCLPLSGPRGISGQCFCKENVLGNRCDRCKEGFWNFDVSNAKGCEACACNSLGALGEECDLQSGECRCKRHATGRSCDHCVDGFWGLSDHKFGCSPCRCDPGGSLDNNCNELTGQCNCRSHVTGKNCSQPEQRFYIPTLDFLTYHVESATKSEGCQLIIRQPQRLFVQMPNQSTISFPIKNLKMSMYYYVSISYEAKEDSTLTMNVIRPTETGFCEYSKENEYFLELEANNKALQLPVAFCLEEKLSYELRFTAVTSGNILIDSIMLLPKIENISWYNQYKINYQDCITQTKLSNDCKSLLTSIGVYLSNGSLPCDCDLTGSSSRFCSEIGGICSCRRNVVGRKCDKCKQGTYGFSSDGCNDCDCNPIGSLDNNCDANGQCNCRSNLYGKQCNQCMPGYWGYPDCVRCECNGHAAKCDAETGACIDCEENTEGDRCDTCLEGYYGKPDLYNKISCRPCPCPGVAGSNHYFANGCHSNISIVCNCLQGYSGDRCDRCAENYFGNPQESECKPCECSGNIDLNAEGNCDSETGECLACLHNTAGFNCELCKPNFYLLESGECIDCECNAYGTDHASDCNNETGQCPCLPNVNGTHCDTCFEDHWNLESEEGCESCDCDPIGSLSSQCDLITGQCECKSNYGGRSCDQCKENFWGNPKLDDCKECECDPDGSTTPQCDRDTGKCFCHLGRDGANCGKCLRSYMEHNTSCVLCGECFDNWDRSLTELRDEVGTAIEKSKAIHKFGTTGAYDEEFREIDSNVKKVESTMAILKSINLTPIDEKSKSLNNDIREINMGPMKDLDNLLAKTSNRIKISNYELQNINEKIILLDKQSNELSYFKVSTESANVPAALQVADDGEVKAKRALAQIESSNKNLDYAERQCKAIRNLLRIADEDSSEEDQTNKRTLKTLKDKLTRLKQKLVARTTVMCGAKICNTRKEVNFSLELLAKVDDELKKIENKANTFIRRLPLADTQAALTEAKEMYQKIESLHDDIGQTYEDVQKIKSSLMQELPMPEEILTTAKEALNTQPISPWGQAQHHLQSINRTRYEQKNVDSTIEDTIRKLSAATNLLDYANNLNSSVDGIFKNLHLIQSKLKTSEYQLDAKSSNIADLRDTRDSINELYFKINFMLNDAQGLLESNSRSITEMLQDVDATNLDATRDEQQAESLLRDSKRIKARADKTGYKLYDINARYCNATSRIKKMDSKAETLKRTTHKLFNNALAISAELKDSEDHLRLLQAQPATNLQFFLQQFEALLRQSESIKAIIRKKYEACR